MRFLASRLLPDDNSSDHRPFAFTALLPAHKPRIKRLVRFPFRRRVRAVHSSSRFDRSPLSLSLAVRSYLTGRNLLTFTEMQDPARRKRLRAVGWATAQDVNIPGGAAECAAMLAKWAWVIENSYALKLSETKIPSRNQYCYALVITARHRRTGQRIKIMVVHLPAHVETDLRIGRRTAQASVYSDCINTMANLAKIWANLSKIDGAIIVGDGNLDWRAPWVREYIGDSFPDYACNWEGRTPKDGGTHEDRLIDWALVLKDGARG